MDMARELAQKLSTHQAVRERRQGSKDSDLYEKKSV